jgi:hypothetical protein
MEPALILDHIDLRGRKRAPERRRARPLPHPIELAGLSIFPASR